MQRNEAESTEREQRGRGGVASIGVRSSERALLHELFLCQSGMHLFCVRIEGTARSSRSAERRAESRIEGECEVDGRRTGRIQ